MIAIRYPYKHRKIMTPRAVAYMISASWILAISPSIPRLFDPGNFIKIAEYGACLSQGESLLEGLLLFTVPTLVSSLPTITIDVYLAIKAVTVSKQKEKETRLSGGTSDKVKLLNQKKATIKKHLKPMITLLIAVLCSTSTGMLISTSKGHGNCYSLQVTHGIDLHAKCWVCYLSGAAAHLWALLQANPSTNDEAAEKYLS